MNDPTIENYGNNKSPNTQCVTMFGVDVYFSYKTPIAFRVGGRLIVRDNEWGPTTGKHLNLIDGGNKANRVTGEKFEALWESLVADVAERIEINFSFLPLSPPPPPINN